MAEYIASKTGALYHASDKFVRLLIGPIGSGKSVASCMDIMVKVLNQQPNQFGVRKSRWVVVRNTYRELIDTTLKTWFDWFPEDIGNFMKQDMVWTIDQEVGDGTRVHAEIMFRALDKPTDVKKLLSLELTGAFINEAREIPKAILDMLMGRVGRYPSQRDGGPSWYGIIMDTNPPDSDHWMYRLFEEELPENHAVFHQPSGTSPRAENTENLPKHYYENMQAGKDQEWVNVYVHGLYGFVQDGNPVYPEYRDDTHYTDMPILVAATATIFIGIDFGLTPAAVFGFKSASGRWYIFDELVTEDMGAKTFGRLLNEKINHEYRAWRQDGLMEIYGDPSGDIRAQTDEVTPFQILAVQGIQAVPTYTNDFLIRREAMAAPMMRLDFTGKPGFCVGPKAINFRKACAGGYKYKRMAVSGQERFQDKPDKGRYSHVAEAGQYLFVGAGEGSEVTSGHGWSKQQIDYTPQNRMYV